MSKKRPVWVNPDWSKARVHTAQEEIRCFGLGCPDPKIAKDAIYTLHRIKASGFYADRPFCVKCHPVREMHPGFNPYEAWREDKVMQQADIDWLAARYEDK